jgi:hypothetical protein
MLKAYWDIKKCSLVTWLLTGHWTMRQHLHIMRLLGIATCKKWKKDVESSYHILCPYLVLTKHKDLLTPHGYSWEISGGPKSSVLALALRLGPYQDQQHRMNPAVPWTLWATDSSPFLAKTNTKWHSVIWDTFPEFYWMGWRTLWPIVMTASVWGKIKTGHLQNKNHKITWHF